MECAVATGAEVPLTLLTGVTDEASPSGDARGRGALGIDGHRMLGSVGAGFSTPGRVGGS